MDEKDIQQKIEYMNEFRNNIIRSMNIRIKISQDRIKAIGLLEQNHKDPNGMGLLRRCIKNERWLLKIIEKGLLNSIAQFKEIQKWNKENIKDEEFKNKSKRLFEIVEIFYSKLKDIDERLMLEDEFIQRQDIDSFRKFVKQWEKEIKLNRKLLKKTVDSSDLEDYFKKIRIITSQALKAGALGGALGALIRKFYFLPEFSDKITGQPLSENKQILISAAISALTLVVASTMGTLENIEKQIEAINIEGLSKAKRSL